MTTAVDKRPAAARLSSVAAAGRLPTALTPLLGTRPNDLLAKRCVLRFKRRFGAERCA
nr:hypothetical protein [Nitrosomonas nitrosa]